MSMCEWVVEGVGILADDIIPSIDKEKLHAMLLEQLPDDEELLAMKRTGNYADLDVDDFLYGEPFENIADLLTFCDDTDSITYGEDGEGSHYFYYPPSMPWHRAENEPESLDEVHKRIITAVKKITTLSDEAIEKMIDDDLYVIGFG